MTTDSLDCRLSHAEPTQQRRTFPPYPAGGAHLVAGQAISPTTTSPSCARTLRWRSWASATPIPTASRRSAPVEGAAHGARRCGLVPRRAGGCRSCAHAAAHARRGHHAGARSGPARPGGKAPCLEPRATPTRSWLWPARGVRMDANHNAAWHPQFLRLKADIDGSPPRRAAACRRDPERAAGAVGRGRARSLDVQAAANVLFEQGPHPLSQILRPAGPGTRATTTCTGRRHAQDRSDVLRHLAGLADVRARHGTAVHGVRRLVSLLAAACHRTGRDCSNRPAGQHLRARSVHGLGPAGRCVAARRVARIRRRSAAPSTADGAVCRRRPCGSRSAATRITSA